MSDIVSRLRDNCIGHPYAKVPWPHHVLNEAADNIEATREAVEWFLEVWETPPPKHDIAYDECEATLLQALADVAKSVGIPRSIKHWMDLVSEETEKSENISEVE
jgi:hypothetical protein